MAHIRMGGRLARAALAGGMVIAAAACAGGASPGGGWVALAGLGKRLSGYRHRRHPDPGAAGARAANLCGRVPFHGEEFMMFQARRSVALVFATAVVVAAALLTAVGAAAATGPAGAVRAPLASWGIAQEVPGAATLK